MMADEVRLTELPQSDGQPRSSWCAVANVVENRPFGPGGVEIRHGTKYFAPGAKVYLVTGYWGMGGESVTVIGRNRRTRRFVRMDMRSNYLRDWRTELAYSPTIIEALAEAGEYTSHGEQAPDSAEAKQHANGIVAGFARSRAATGPRHLPVPGPLPDEAKDLFSEYGPVGCWSALPADATEQPGPREVRFFTNRTGFFLPHSSEASSNNPTRFRWRLAALGRIYLRTPVPGEPAPLPWDSSSLGPDCDEVAYEFRLVVKPTVAFEALAETNRDGFWISPLPLVWSGLPFRTAP